MKLKPLLITAGGLLTALLVLAIVFFVNSGPAHAPGIDQQKIAETTLSPTPKPSAKSDNDEAIKHEKELEKAPVKDESPSPNKEEENKAKAETPKKSEPAPKVTPQPAPKETSKPVTPAPKPTPSPKPAEPTPSPTPKPTPPPAPAPTPTPTPPPAPEPTPPPAPAITIDTSEQQAVLSLVNATRAQNGVPAVALNDKLTNAAITQARYQAEIGKMTHDGNGGLGSRISAAGFCWTTAGENVAMGYSNGSAVHNGWINSPGHFNNIVNERVTHMGLAKAVASNGAVYWAQVFARAC